MSTARFAAQAIKNERPVEAIELLRDKLSEVAGDRQIYCRTDELFKAIHGLKDSLDGVTGHIDALEIAIKDTVNYQVGEKLLDILDDIRNCADHCEGQISRIDEDAGDLFEGVMDNMGITQSLNFLVELIEELKYYDPTAQKASA